MLDLAFCKGDLKSQEQSAGSIGKYGEETRFVEPLVLLLSKKGVTHSEKVESNVVRRKKPKSPRL